MVATGKCERSPREQRGNFFLANKSERVDAHKVNLLANISHGSSAYDLMVGQPGSETIVRPYGLVDNHPAPAEIFSALTK
jgi:hypothetical protein